MISLAEHNPELINEWDYEKNGELGLNPYTVSYGSARKVWWKCNKGHSYLMGLNSRTTHGKAKQQCSVCAGIQIIDGCAVAVRIMQIAHIGSGHIVEHLRPQ